MCLLFVWLGAGYCAGARVSLLETCHFLVTCAQELEKRIFEHDTCMMEEKSDEILQVSHQLVGLMRLLWIAPLPDEDPHNSLPAVKEWEGNEY